MGTGPSDGELWPLSLRLYGSENPLQIELFRVTCDEMYVEQLCVQEDPRIFSRKRF
jgi:hypothetical protein